MSGYPPVSPPPELPQEFQFLCMLHNVGATSVERALTIEDITKWTNENDVTVQEHLRRLNELGYVQFVMEGDIGKYHVSPTGIRKVLTLYS